MLPPVAPTPRGGRGLKHLSAPNRPGQTPAWRPPPGVGEECNWLHSPGATTLEGRGAHPPGWARIETGSSGESAPLPRVAPTPRGGRGLKLEAPLQGRPPRRWRPPPGVGED